MNRRLYDAALLYAGVTMVLAGQAVASDVTMRIIMEEEKTNVLHQAAQYLQEPPRTVTADRCERSAGGARDFYSEGDYWWPNPKDPDGPYIRRDGEINPDMFVAHRDAMERLSDVIGSMASAYLITKEDKYVEHAVLHLKAWFVDKETRMNPHLLYGQAIKGRYTGRGIGIIDTMRLVQAARGAKILGTSASFTEQDQAEIKAWFRDYLTWINEHPYGKKEKHHPNNHGVCWSLQAAAFADLLGDQEQLAWIRQEFKTVYLGKMMNEDGAFPAELRRTRPFAYSLLIIDAMAGVAQIASIPEDDLWEYELPDGRSMRKAMAFIAPHIKDKSTWPMRPDIQKWDELPMQQPCLLFAGLRFKNRDYLETWTRLAADGETDEMRRPVAALRHPLLWIGLANDEAPSPAPDSREATTTGGE